MNRTVYFCTDGIWLCDGLEEPIRWFGPAEEILSILIYHEEFDLQTIRFRVQDREFGE